MNGSVSPKSASKGSNFEGSSSSGAKKVGNGSNDISGFLYTASFMNTKFPVAPGTWKGSSSSERGNTINKSSRKEKCSPLEDQE